MAYEIGDGGHITVHNELPTRLSSLALVWGVTVTLPPARELGAAGHVDDHNLIVQAIRDIHAAQLAAGALVDPLPELPDTAAVDDLGHVDDHNAIEAGVEVVEAGRFPYNAATGGTVTYYTDGEGQAWAVHTFTASGDFVVTESVQPFRALVVAGGGAGGRSQSGLWSSGAGGAGGMIDVDDLTLPVGTHPAVVGAGATYAANILKGYDSTFGGLTAVGGGCSQQDNGNGRAGGSGSGGGQSGSGGGPGGSGVAGQGYAGGTNTGSGGGAGGPGGDNNGPAGPGRVSTITGTAVTYATGGQAKGVTGTMPPVIPNSGNGGAGASGNAGTFSGQDGASGVVIVSYAVGSIPSDYVEHIGTTLPTPEDELGVGLPELPQPPDPEPVPHD